jgi:hypothetical protein
LLVGLAITAFIAYVVPDLWAETTKAGARITENFTPENAARQRAVLRRFSPALERMAGNKIEQFLSDPVVFYNENLTTPSTATVDEDGNVKAASTGNGAAILATLVSSLDLLLFRFSFFIFWSISAIGAKRWKI